MLLRYERPANSTFLSELSSPSSALNTPLDANPSFTISYESFHSQDKFTVNKMDTAEVSLPVQLQLIAVRRVGITPVFLVPFCESLRSDIIALSDRPWLIQIARHSQKIAYTSVERRPNSMGYPEGSMGWFGTCLANIRSHGQDCC